MTEMMKKILIVLLAAVLAVAGCSGRKSAGEPEAKRTEETEDAEEEAIDLARKLYLPGYRKFSFGKIADYLADEWDCEPEYDVTLEGQDYAGIVDITLDGDSGDVDGPVVFTILYDEDEDLQDVWIAEGDTFMDGEEAMKALVGYMEEYADEEDIRFDRDKAYHDALEWLDELGEYDISWEDDKLRAETTAAVVTTAAAETTAAATTAAETTAAATTAAYETTAAAYPAGGGSEDFVCPDSSVRQLTDSEISDLYPGALRVAKNEIYARHGRKFTSQELDRYFNSKSWYNGTIEAASFSENMLSSIEKDNVTKLDRAFQGLTDGYVESTAAERGVAGGNSYACPTQRGDYWYCGTDGYDLELDIGTGGTTASLMTWRYGMNYSWDVYMQNDTVYAGTSQDGSSIMIEFEQGGKYAFVSFGGSDEYDIYTFFDRTGY